MTPPDDQSPEVGGGGLTEFVLARIAEDEAAAHSLPREGYMKTIVSHRATRVLAECDAKRKRVELFTRWDALCAPDDWPENGSMEGAPLSDAGRHLLRIETLPYSDHPDYRKEWRA
jgi:hypothetical protein